MEILPPENKDNKSQFGNFENLTGNEKLTHIIYLLQAIGIFNGITALIAIVLNYVKRDDVKGGYLESHFTWQIKTFWKGVIICAVGVITLPILIGGLILFAGFVWYIIRVVKGWVKLADKKPIEDPSKFI